MTILVSSPIFWLSGMVSFLMGIALGFKVVFFRGPAKEAVLLSAIHNFKVSTQPESTITPERCNFKIQGLVLGYASCIMQHINEC